jgi:hypothetical protein
VGQVVITVTCDSTMNYDETIAEIQRIRAETAENKRKLAALTRESEELTERIARKSEELLQVRKERHAERMRQRQAAEAAALSISLLDGTYFTPIHEVWGVTTATYDDKRLLAKLQRTRTPDMYECYSLARDHATARIGSVADKIGASPSSEEFDPRLPTDMFGSDCVASEVAHLVPDDVDRASVYFAVAQCALAMNDLPSGTRERMKVLQKSIHGTLSASSGRRIENSGMKHFPTNKIRLAHERVYFSERPCIVIVPIMSLQAMIDWNGQGYRAVVLAGNHHDAPAFEVYRAIRAGFLSPGTRLSDVLASKGDSERARQLLTAVVRGLAYWLHHPDHLLESKLSIGADKILSDLRRNFASSHTQRTVCVPDSRVPPNQSVHVRVVTFADPGNYGHQAPDPLLLAVKSAINWSWRNQQKLLAVGEPPEEEDEMAVLALELHHEYIQSLSHVKSTSDLAHGLHQPHGYQGE